MAYRKSGDRSMPAVEQYNLRVAMRAVTLKMFIYVSFQDKKSCSRLLSPHNLLVSITDCSTLKQSYRRPQIA